jgi:hypothetical protein
MDKRLKLPRKPNQEKVDIRVLQQKLSAGRQRDPWTMIATHAIDGNGDHVAATLLASRQPGRKSIKTKARGYRFSSIGPG